MARKDDVKTMDSLHARCTRLLAMLSFVYPIRKVGASYTLRNIELPEFELRSTSRGLRVLSHSAHSADGPLLSVDVRGLLLRDAGQLQLLE